jgi:hypothetical protein
LLDNTSSEKDVQEAIQVISDTVKRLRPESIDTQELVQVENENIRLTTTTHGLG